MKSAKLGGVPPKYLVLVVLTPVVLLLDQLTKLFVVSTFRLNESRNVIPWIFSLTYVRNTGAAFGILHDANPAFRIPFFIVVPLVALGAIGFVFRKIRADDWRLSSALSLVIGGAIGNLLDRVRLGFVVDFLDFHWNFRHHFPAFNIADSAICIGVGVLMLDLMAAQNDASGEKKDTEVKVDAPAPP